MYTGSRLANLFAEDDSSDDEVDQFFAEIRRWREQQQQQQKAGGGAGAGGTGGGGRASSSFNSGLNSPLALALKDDDSSDDDDLLRPSLLQQKKQPPPSSTILTKSQPPPTPPSSSTINTNIRKQPSLPSFTHTNIKSKPSAAPPSRHPMNGQGKQEEEERHKKRSIPVWARLKEEEKEEINDYEEEDEEQEDDRKQPSPINKRKNKPASTRDGGSSRSQKAAPVEKEEEKGERKRAMPDWARSKQQEEDIDDDEEEEEEDEEEMDRNRKLSPIKRKKARLAKTRGGESKSSSKCSSRSKKVTFAVPLEEEEAEDEKEEEVEEEVVEEGEEEYDEWGEPINARDLETRKQELAKELLLLYKEHLIAKEKVAHIKRRREQIELEREKSQHLLMKLLTEAAQAKMLLKKMEKIEGAMVMIKRKKGLKGMKEEDQRNPAGAADGGAEVDRMEENDEEEEEDDIELMEVDEDMKKQGGAGDLQMNKAKQEEVLASSSNGTGAAATSDLKKGSEEEDKVVNKEEYIRELQKKIEEGEKAKEQAMERGALQPVLRAAHTLTHGFAQYYDVNGPTHLRRLAMKKPFLSSANPSTTTDLLVFLPTRKRKGGRELSLLESFIASAPEYTRGLAMFLRIKDLGRLKQVSRTAYQSCGQGAFEEIYKSLMEEGERRRRRKNNKQHQQQQQKGRIGDEEEGDESEPDEKKGKGEGKKKSMMDGRERKKGRKKRKLEERREQQERLKREEKEGGGRGWIVSSRGGGGGGGGAAVDSDEEEEEEEEEDEDIMWLAGVRAAKAAVGAATAEAVANGGGGGVAGGEGEGAAGVAAAVFNGGGAAVAGAAVGLPPPPPPPPPPPRRNKAQNNSSNAFEIDNPKDVRRLYRERERQMRRREAVETGQEVDRDAEEEDYYFRAAAGLGGHDDEEKEDEGKEEDEGRGGRGWVVPRLQVNKGQHMKSAIVEEATRKYQRDHGLGDTTLQMKRKNGKYVLGGGDKGGTKLYRFMLESKDHTIRRQLETLLEKHDNRLFCDVEKHPKCMNQSLILLRNRQKKMKPSINLKLDALLPVNKGGPGRKTIKALAEEAVSAIVDLDAQIGVCHLEERNLGKKVDEAKKSVRQWVGQIIHVKGLGKIIVGHEQVQEQVLGMLNLNVWEALPQDVRDKILTTCCVVYVEDKFAYSIYDRQLKESKAKGLIHQTDIGDVDELPVHHDVRLREAMEEGLRRKRKQG